MEGMDIVLCILMVLNILTIGAAAIDGLRRCDEDGTYKGIPIEVTLDKARSAYHMAQQINEVAFRHSERLFALEQKLGKLENPKPNKQVIRQRPQRECVTNYFGEDCKDCGFYVECGKLTKKTDVHGNAVTLCDVINNRL